MQDGLAETQGNLQLTNLVAFRADELCLLQYHITLRDIWALDVIWTLETLLAVAFGLIAFQRILKLR